MRVTAFLALFMAVVATSFVAGETNGQRFARGLPPNPPARRGASGTETAEHHHHSGIPKHHGDDKHDDHENKHDDHEDNKHDDHEYYARGLPPVRRAPSDTDSAHAHRPSHKPHKDDHEDDGKCKTGPVQCCNSISSAADPVTKTILDLYGVKSPGSHVPIGCSCSPLGNKKCAKETVCCEHNDFEGVIAIGCTSVKISD